MSEMNITKSQKINTILCCNRDSRTDTVKPAQTLKKGNGEKSVKNTDSSTKKETTNNSMMMTSSFTTTLQFMATKASYRIMMITINLLMVKRVINLRYSLPTAGLVYHVFNLQGDMVAGTVNICFPTIFLVAGSEPHHCMYSH